MSWKEIKPYNQRCIDWYLMTDLYNTWQTDTNTTDVSVIDFSIKKIILYTKYIHEKFPK